MDQTLRVVLCWHMHQPQYRDLISGQYQLPWTYLHATKDYVDMAAILEGIPEARAVINFAPVLLDQIADYAEQVKNFLVNNQPLRDPLLAALGAPVLPVNAESCMVLITQCLRANERNLIRHFPHYELLAGLARTMCREPRSLHYLNEQFLGDLLTWYHLAWLGETVRRGDERVQRLLNKKEGFTLHDRRQLVVVIGELLSGIIPRYRRLAESGQIELSMSPYDHPIMPLLQDITSARESESSVSLPALDAYPGGTDRVRRHVEDGKAAFQRHFGMTPRGCWPSEGGVSEPTSRLLAELGFEWMASGERVLYNSLERGERRTEGCHHHPFRIEAGGITCFFRDDSLSDLIGFTYSDWQSDDAVNNLVHHLENIAEHCGHDPNAVVSIILDGENAWEHYPFNGFYFLTSLYRRLAAHPKLELSTFSACLDAGIQTDPLSHLVAGSWVYGTFSTWIGNSDKNRAWELLGKAKRHLDAAVKEERLGGPRLQAAEQQLSVCEGSDWFWWLGDYNPADSVSEFERLYRQHLANLYTLIAEEPPEGLTHPLSRGSGSPEQGGAMRRGQEPH